MPLPGHASFERFQLRFETHRSALKRTLSRHGSVEPYTTLLELLGQGDRPRGPKPDPDPMESLEPLARARPWGLVGDAYGFLLFEEALRRRLGADEGPRLDELRRLAVAIGDLDWPHPQQRELAERARSAGRAHLAALSETPTAGPPERPWSRDGLTVVSSSSRPHQTA